LHRFRDIAFQRSKSLYLAIHLGLTPDGGVPRDDLRKVFTKKSGMAEVPNGVETLPKISIAWVRCTNVTDRRQTDGRTATYREREREFTFAEHEITQHINTATYSNIHTSKW